jgi:hypothetical protein
MTLNNVIDEKEMMTRYLLGDLSESEQRSFEQQYFSEPRVFERLLVVESELMDDYARNRLNKDVRARFEQHYLADAARRERAAFADALTRRLDQQQKETVIRPSFWRRLITSLDRPALAYAGAVACLILLSAGIWLFISMRRLREQLAQSQASQAEHQRQVRELEQQIANEQARLAAERERLARQQPSPSPSTSSSIAALALVVSGVRSAQVTKPLLIIRKGTREVHLHVTVKDTDYKTFQAIVSPVGGNAIHNSQPKSNGSFTLVMPAAKFTVGDYVLTLKAVNERGESEEVSKSLFRVQQK